MMRGAAFVAWMGLATHGFSLPATGARSTRAAPMTPMTPMTPSAGRRRHLPTAAAVARGGASEGSGASFGVVGSGDRSAAAPATAGGGWRSTALLALAHLAVIACKATLPVSLGHISRMDGWDITSVQAQSTVAIVLGKFAVNQASSTCSPRLTGQRLLANRDTAPSNRQTTTILQDCTNQSHRHRHRHRRLAKAKSCWVRLPTGLTLVC